MKTPTTAVDQKGHPLRCGDPVSFTVIKDTGSTIRLSAREGKVTSIQGAYAEVKLRNGRTRQVPVADLRRSDLTEHNELTEALLGSHGLGEPKP